MGAAASVRWRPRHSLPRARSDHSSVLFSFYTSHLMIITAAAAAASAAAAGTRRDPQAPPPRPLRPRP